jgi:transposase-like protein
MDKRYLEDCLANGMSLEAIGKSVGRHPRTVRYWLYKHGLRPLGSEREGPRDPLLREEIEPLIESGLTIEGIAQELGVSDTTAKYWLRKYGLQTKPASRRAAARAARAAASRG